MRSVHPSPSRPLLPPHTSPCSSAGPSPGCSPSGTTCSRLGSPRPQLLQERSPCCGVGPSPGCRVALCSSGLSPGLQGIPAPGLQHLLPSSSSSSSALGLPLLLLPPCLPPPLPVPPLALAETWFPPGAPSLAEGLGCVLRWGRWSRLGPAGTGCVRPGAAPASPHRGCPAAPAASAWAPTPGTVL